MSLPKVFNIYKKNIINMKIVLTEYEKNKGVKIFTSIDLFQATLCRIRNCLNKIENFNLCIKHKKYKII
jgi:hypothetical protein